jgi:hypothetical protein
MRRWQFLLLILGAAAATLVWSRIDKNGFDLSNASIPVAEVLSGGPPRDGIPAIDKPRFIAAHRADFLTDDSRVIGVSLGDEARAYPIAILNWHEIVNDHINGEAIVVTFCPLCGTGMVFETSPYTDFGVSGLLYNSDVLLYDRQTESLWSQLKMQAVSGKRLGEKLTLLAASHTSWADWRARYPHTRVLSTETGFRRDYQRDPYRDYAKQRQTYFPVANQNSRYHPKEMVIGVVQGETVKAWPFAELAKADQAVADTLGSEAVTVIFNAEARSGRVVDANGEEIPSTTGFWFAWMAFYPQSEVYQH